MRRATPILFAMILVGCDAVSSASITPPARTASPSPSPAAELTPPPTSPPTSGPTFLAERTAGATPTESPCPAAPLISVTQLVNARLACFGSDEVTIRAWLDTPTPMGWLPPLVEPAWLYYPAEAQYNSLWSTPPTTDPHLCSDAALDCAWIFIHLAPDSEIVLTGPARWVLVTGHRDDPAAANCHYVESSVAPGPFDDTEVKAVCRQHFLLSSIEDAPTP